MYYHLNYHQYELFYNLYNFDDILINIISILLHSCSYLLLLYIEVIDCHIYLFNIFDHIDRIMLR